MGGPHQKGVYIWRRGLVKRAYSLHYLLHMAETTVARLLVGKPPLAYTLQMCSFQGKVM